MISKSLSTSRKYAALTSQAGELAEFCQALFPLVVAHADDFGRLPGDVFTIRHLVWPTSTRSLEQFNAALTALDHVGLILRYRANGGDYIQVLHFEEHQVGLSKRTKSKFPKPNGVSKNFQESPEQLNRTEQNLTEENLTELNRKKDGGLRPPANLSVSDDVAEKAGRFLERYQTVYAEERRGAHFQLKPVLHYQTACELVQGWPDLERLELMFRTFCKLPPSEKMAWPGTPAQFLHLAPSIDAKLRAVGA